MTCAPTGGCAAASLLLLWLATCILPLPVFDDQQPDLGSLADSGCEGCCPCTDPSSCCFPSEQACGPLGPDGGGPTCLCERLWSCSTADTCTQALVDSLPGSVWTCGLDGASVVCSAPGDAGEPPPPAPALMPTSWSCAYNPGTATWRCERKTAANPCNSAVGAEEWSCSVAPSGHLRCDRR